MGLFSEDKEKLSTFEKARNNFITSQKRAARTLIKEFDKIIEHNSYKGSYGAHIYYKRYGFVVRDECIQMVIKHYEEKGFNVELSDREKYPSNRSIGVWWG